ncbi:MAG: anthranilate synthase component I [Rhodobacteraceae bacterium]|nr:anthranilate synthase component I [Paracoccaceae bacterium]
MAVSPSYEEFVSAYERGLSQIVHAPLAADLDTPVSLMLKLSAAEKNSFILESVTGGEIRGRYSIVGMKPDLLWQCRDGVARINRSDGFADDAWEEEPGGPFASLRRLISRSRISLPEGMPAASAGLFGYLGYDMIRHVESLPHVNPDTLGIPDSILIRPSVVAVLDGVKGEVTIVSTAWADSGLPAREAYERACGHVGEAIGRIESRGTAQPRNIGAAARVGDAESDTSKGTYMRVVEQAKQYIRAGDIFQVVPSLRWKLEFNLPPFALYRALRRTNPSPFMFFFNFDSFQIIGASPEILVRVFGNEITVRPIAGTRRRGTTPEEDKRLEAELLADAKERAEHLMLLDLGRNDVGRVSKTGTVRPTEQFIVERYSHVMHIVSNVVGELDAREDALSALLAGLPAGTVSGAPKVRAMQIIDELETVKRGVYAGGVGYFSSNGDMDMCIALRTAVLKDNALYIQAGGGVVHDSDPEEEWIEAVNKSEALRKAAEDAAMFSGGE